ncbi:MAG TPA: YggT family protein [Gemmatimonadales bacterium]|nr:YggT family protein [Gemmatimonadales bacterium]
MSDDKVLVDEARRAAQHRRVKQRIQQDVDAEIEARAPQVRDDREVAQVGAELRERALQEVHSSEHEVQRGRKSARASQIVDYLFGIVYALLGIRLLLALIAARPGAGFTQAIRGVTDPLLAPFQGILPNLTSPDGYTLALPVLFALLMYAVLHLAVRGLLRLIGERKTHV